MAIVSKDTLKGYFNDGDVPGYPEYIDVIDSLGIPALALLVTGDWNDVIDTGWYRGNALTNGPTSSYYFVEVMSHSENYVSQLAYYYFNPKIYWRQKDNGVWTSWKVVWPAAWGDITGKPSVYTPASHTHPGGDITSAVGDSSKLGNVAAAEYLQRTSLNRPGVTRLYRDDSDSGYYLRISWTGSRWDLEGYYGGSPQAGVQVEYADTSGNADKVDFLEASQFVRSDANDTKSGYLDSSSYIDAALGYRINGTQLGNIIMYPAASYKGHTDWDFGEIKSTGQYTLTRAMFGYPSTARYVYIRLAGKASSGEGYYGCNEDGLYNFSVGGNSYTTHSTASSGWVMLTSTGGNFYVRIGNASIYCLVRVLGYSL